MGKEMHITMLKGDKDTGKTTVLNLVYDELLKQGWKVELPKKLIGPAEGKDFVATLTKDKKRIAFFTSGDYTIFVFVAIEIIARLDVDILLIACRTDRFDKCFESKELGTPKTILENYSHEIIPSDLNNQNKILQQILDDINKDKRSKT